MMTCITDTSQPTSRRHLSFLFWFPLSVFSSSMLGLLVAMSKSRNTASLTLAYVLILALWAWLVLIAVYPKIPRRIAIAIPAAIWLCLISIFAFYWMGALRTQWAGKSAERLGGEVTFEYENETDYWVQLRDGSVIPRIFPFLLGDAYFAGASVVFRSGNVDQRINEVDLSRFEEIDFLGSTIGDEGLRNIRHLGAVGSLNISSERVTDEGINSIVRHSKVKRLWLMTSNVTEDGALQLKHMKALEELYLRSRGATPNAAVQLRSALPKCYVIVVRSR